MRGIGRGAVSNTPSPLTPYSLPDHAPMRTRTSNLLIRSQMLYPIELWALVPSGRQAGPEGAVI